MKVMICSYSWFVFDPPLLNLGTELALGGNRALAIGIGRLQDPRYEMRANPGFEIRRTPWSRYKLLNHPLLRALRYLVTVCSAAMRQKPDCYIAANWNSFLAILVAVVFHRAPVIYYQLEYTGGAANGSWLVKLTLQLERWLISRAAVIFSAEPNRSQLMKAYYGLADLPQAIYNAPRLLIGGDRPQIAPDAGNIKFVYMGSISTRSAIDSLLRALQLAKLPLEVDLYGHVTESFSDSFRELLEAAALVNSVTYSGVVDYDQVQQRLRRYQVGLVFYNSDNLNQYYCSPAKLFEYLSAGLAILSSSLPGLRAIVETCEVGVCVDHSDPKQLWQSLQSLCTNRKNVQDMQGRAYNAYLTVYNFQKQAEPLLERLSAYSQNVSG